MGTMGVAGFFASFSCRSTSSAKALTDASSRPEATCAGSPSEVHSTGSPLGWTEPGNTVWHPLARSSTIILRSLVCRFVVSTGAVTTYTRCDQPSACSRKHLTAAPTDLVEEVRVTRPRSTVMTSRRWRRGPKAELVAGLCTKRTWRQRESVAALSAPCVHLPFVLT